MTPVLVAICGLEKITMTSTSNPENNGAMLSLSPRDQIENKEIRPRTKVVDVIHLVANLKWQCVGHMARQDPNKWTD